MTDYIALVGSKGAGKTCFMGGLHAKYETAPPFPMFAKVKREEFEGEGWYHCVNFCIDRLEFAADQTFFTEISEGLRTLPRMEFPEETRLPDQYPMRIRFISKELTNRYPTNHTRLLSLVDIPGKQLAPDYEDQAQRARTIDRLLRCEAFIVFIDTEAYEQYATGAGVAVIEQIGQIVATAAKAARETGDPEKIIPVSIVFSKFDLCPEENRQAITDKMFEHFALKLSSYSGNVYVMTCPISIVDRKGSVFSAYNLNFPFLFSSMGIIFARALAAAQRAQTAAERAADARAMRHRSWWQRFTTFLQEGKTAGAMQRESQCPSGNTLSRWNHL